MLSVTMVTTRRCQRWEHIVPVAVKSLEFNYPKKKKKKTLHLLAVFSTSENILESPQIREALNGTAIGMIQQPPRVFFTPPSFYASERCCRHSAVRRGRSNPNSEHEIWWLIVWVTGVCKWKGNFPRNITMLSELSWSGSWLQGTSWRLLWKPLVWH